MFGPRDQAPMPLFDAKTCRLVFEDAVYIVISTDDGWRKYQISNDQVWGLFEDMAGKIRDRR
jgi:hypothetical protein